MHANVLALEIGDAADLFFRKQLEAANVLATHDRDRFAGIDRDDEGWREVCGEVDLATMAAFAARSYDTDVQAGEGFPAEAEELRDRITASDAFVIASPEYNASMPGVLKNSIDWVSRFSPQPFKIDG